MSETLIGQIDKILFEDEGFFIAVLKSGEKVSGTYYESAVKNIKGSAITLHGMWEEHKKYGKSFKFTSCCLLTICSSSFSCSGLDAIFHLRLLCFNLID